MPQAAIQKENFVSVDRVDVGIDQTMPSNKVTWSTGRNVRFSPGFVSKTLGKTLVATLPTASLNVRKIFTFMDWDGNMHSVICTDAKVYAANGDYTAFTDITPTPAPTGGMSDIWKFTIVAGLPILTNGKDGMWKWPDPTQPLTTLLNVPLAKNIGCSMHRLVLSNIWENNRWCAGRIRWSETGNPENFTIDATKKSGRQDLMNYQEGSDTQHNIMCQVSEGSKVYFFTSRNLWLSDFAETTKQFVIIDNDIQIVSPQSALAFEGSIYVVDKRDIYRFTNGRKDAIGRPIKGRSTFYIDGLNLIGMSNAYFFPMFSANELWFCFSTGANTGLPDTAFIYNWELSTDQNPVWSIHDCDFLCHSLSFSPEYYPAWINNSLATVTWTNNAAATIQWLTARYNQVAEDIVGDSASHIMCMECGNNALDTTLTPQPIYGVIESGDMALGSRSLEKIMEDLFPDMDVQTLTNSLMIQVGIRDSLAQSISWSKAVPFRIGIDRVADLRSYTSQGAYIRLRFYTNALDTPWSLASYGFSFLTGRRIR
jgi:hypothetical protein